MTGAIIITLIASFMWATTNHIDKYLLCKIGSTKSNIKTLMLFSTFVAGIVLLPIWLVINKFQVQINLVALIFIFLAAILYFFGTYFYFKALEKNDASIVVVMFQLIPVFSYIFSVIFFNEHLGTNEIIGGLIIILSAIIISFEFGESSDKNKGIALTMMTFSSLLYSLYFIFFDFAMRNGEYNSVAFWYQVGLLSIGIVLLFIKKYRQPFISMIKENGKKFISLNVTNEVINLVGNLMMNFANLALPLALVNTLSGFQGVFAFIIGAVGVLICPKIFSEELSKKIVIQKTISIILSIAGLVVMFH